MKKIKKLKVCKWCSKTLTMKSKTQLISQVKYFVIRIVDSSDSAESEDGIQYLDELDDSAIDDLMEQMHDAPLGEEEFQRYTIQQKLVATSAASRILFTKAKINKAARVVFEPTKSDE